MVGLELDQLDAFGHLVPDRKAQRFDPRVALARVLRF